MPTTIAPMSSPVIAGMMRIAELSDQQIRELYSAYLEAGVTAFDHADIYGSFTPGGGYHFCEQRFADALKLSPSQRSEITLQTKCGIVAGPGKPTYYDHSFDHIIASVEGSLKALGTDYVDTLLLHRPDTWMQPEEVARAFEHLESTGKVVRFGVSNFTPAQIELLQTSVRQPIVTNQVQFSLTHATLVNEGLCANITTASESVVRTGHLLEYARREGIGLQAWSPLQSPDGSSLLDQKANPQLTAALRRIADVHQITPSGVAFAWIASHPAGIVPVAGTTNPAHASQAIEGARTQLSRQEWYELYQAAGHRLP